MEKLPCPFCGTTDLDVMYEDIDGWIAHIRCLNCDFDGPDSFYKWECKEDACDDAIEVWNIRY